jgi:thioredoxin reductase (NADPH)
LQEAENVEFHWNSAVTQLLGENLLSGVILQDVQTGAEQVLSLDGLFISVGRSPATALFRDQLQLDSSGYIVADESTRTNIPGVFAVGDVRTKAVRQIVTAAADGAVAAHYAEEHLAERG